MSCGNSRFAGGDEGLIAVDLFSAASAIGAAAALGARKMSKPQLLSALNLPRNYPLSKSAALCVNTAFAYPYYILPILFPRKKPLGLSPAIFGIMQSVMQGVIVVGQGTDGTARC